MSRQIIRLEDMEKFASELFDQPKEADKAAAILKGILEARSLRLTDLSQVMKGSPQASYKALQRFLKISSRKKLSYASTRRMLPLS